MILSSQPVSLALMLLAQHPAAKKMVLAATDWRKISNILLNKLKDLVCCPPALPGVYSPPPTPAGTDLTLISLWKIQFVKTDKVEHQWGHAVMQYLCEGEKATWGHHGYRLSGPEGSAFSFFPFHVDKNYHVQVTAFTREALSDHYIVFFNKIKLK